MELAVPKKNSLTNNNKNKADRLNGFLKSVI
jgi:hypothetical protein